jgi:hypothetical protein
MPWILFVVASGQTRMAANRLAGGGALEGRVRSCGMRLRRRDAAGC